MRTMMALVLMSSLPYGSCVIWDGVICTEIFVYGINVALTDDATGDPIEGATLTLTEGDFSEVMQELSPGQYVGAGERAGTYQLTIEAEGFTSETITDIEIDEDECHVIPETLEVALTPAS